MQLNGLAQNGIASHFIQTIYVRSPFEHTHTGYILKCTQICQIKGFQRQIRDLCQTKLNSSHSLLNVERERGETVH